MRKVAKRVDPKEIDDPLFQQLIDDMFETMYDAPGIGLAAPQINVSKRIFTIDLQDDEPDHGPFVVINPKLEVLDGGVDENGNPPEEAQEWRKDGCLSYKGFVGESLRYKHAVVTGLNRDGNKIRLEGDGLFAHCLQHEIDHLNGKLYIDEGRNIHEAPPEEEEQSDEGGDAVS